MVGMRDTHGVPQHCLVRESRRHRSAASGIEIWEVCSGRPSRRMAAGADGCRVPEAVAVQRCSGAW